MITVLGDENFHRFFFFVKFVLGNQMNNKHNKNDIIHLVVIFFYSYQLFMSLNDERL